MFALERLPVSRRPRWRTVTAALGVSLLLAAPACGETVSKAVFGPALMISGPQCAAVRETVWISAYGRELCMRYYLSNAGGKGSWPVVFLQGDWPTPNVTIETGELARYADKISANTGTTGIYLARLGREGSSGSVDDRHSYLEVQAVNAALDAIKQRYRFSGFHIYGHSGGATLAADLLALRSDIGCDVSADPALSGFKIRDGLEPALQPLNPTDWIPNIAQNRSARFLVITDPEDRQVTAERQTPFVEALKRTGRQVDQLFVDSSSYDTKLRHFTTPHAEVAIRDCLRGASTREIGADIDQLVARHVAKR